jgi:hypothetical protein
MCKLKKKIVDKKLKIYRKNQRNQVKYYKGEEHSRRIFQVKDSIIFQKIIFIREVFQRVFFIS